MANRDRQCLYPDLTGRHRLARGRGGDRLRPSRYKVVPGFHVGGSGSQPCSSQPQLGGTLPVRDHYTFRRYPFRWVLLEVTIRLLVLVLSLLDFCFTCVPSSLVVSCHVCTEPTRSCWRRTFAIVASHRASPGPVRRWTPAIPVLLLGWCARQQTQ